MVFQVSLPTVSTRDAPWRKTVHGETHKPQTLPPPVPRLCEAIYLVLQTLHQDATRHTNHGSNLTACALDTAGLTPTWVEWYQPMAKTVCAETSISSITSSITAPFWPHREASTTPTMKIWLNASAILYFGPNRTSPVSSPRIWKKQV